MYFDDGSFVPAADDDVKDPRDDDAASFLADVVFAMAPLASRTGPWLAPVQILETFKIDLTHHNLKH